MITGVGLDVVEIERVGMLLEAQGDRARTRLFSDDERAYCDAKAFPARHYAARIAAKEAAFKALSGTESARGIGWREIEVELDALGRPALLLHGGAERRATELGVTRAWVTLTHSDATAAAVVILESRE